METRSSGSDWERSIEQIKKEHPHLTDEDLRFEPGKEEELLERLQQKLGKTKKEIRNWLHIMG